MKFIGDFHIHSHFSLATSKELRPDFLDYWAGLKGIKVVGTGDFTHPGWLKELNEQLEPAEEGLFKLKNEFRRTESSFSPENVRFILTTEISNIYKKRGKVRKVHNVLFAPSFEIAEKIQNKLVNLGFNISSDGRPILGLDSRNLLEICLDISGDIFFLPAHIWTPWFSVLGSKSGFDSINECFEDLSDHITAVEMGLSTDPPMNWMCSFLDKYTLIANSDAHSPEKLGRNANIFDTNLSYYDIINSIKTGNSNSFLGTIDFFPQEGKYHYDGHRKCGIRWDPLDTLQNNEICPVCGKRITVGVMNRIAQLADRDNVLDRKNRHPFYSLIPLKEILSEIEDASPDSFKVDQYYKQLIKKTGPEFNLILHYDIANIRSMGGELLSEAIRRMRNREVYIEEGYDGEYGTVKVFKPGEIKKYSPSLSISLFEEPGNNYLTLKDPLPLLSFDLKKYRDLKQEKSENDKVNEISSPMEYNVHHKNNELDCDQEEAAKHFSGPALIMAGPGTGKTKVLTSRIAYLTGKKNINPGSILAITFTNKAAGEMRNRLSSILDKQIVDNLNIYTFHAFGFSIIREYFRNSGITTPFSVIDEDDKEHILSELGVEKSIIKETVEKISEIKQSMNYHTADNNYSINEIFTRYNHRLRESNTFDLDDLICHPVQLFLEHPEFLSMYRKKIEWVLVDEYQDINLPQYKMIRMLMPEDNSNLFVIGDPDQSVYGFRGADVRYIRIFREDYKEASVYKLIRSYRCPDSILQASGNILISDTGVFTGLKKGIKIKIVENATDKSEAEFVARTIENMIGGVGFFSIDSQITGGEKDEGIESLSDFAILCRIGKQMHVLEKALNDHNIPCHRVAENPLFKQEPVKSVMDIYRLMVNPGNSVLRSRITKNKIIGENELQALYETLKDKNIACRLEYIINHYFSNHFNDNESLVKLILETADQYKNNENDFLQTILSGTGVDTWKPAIEAVNLMTLHASKGLEFNCVFITGCEENLLPYSMFENQSADPEEERRLLYVGMTRSKEYLFLTNARRRFIMGREYSQKRSHFLDNIEKELVEYKAGEFKVKANKDIKQLKLF